MWPEAPRAATKEAEGVPAGEKRGVWVTVRWRTCSPHFQAGPRTTRAPAADAACVTLRPGALAAVAAAEGAALLTALASSWAT